MYGAVIVETRPIENLQEIIQDRHLKFIPKDWGLTLYLSNANRILIDETLLGRNTQVFILPDIFPANEYNKLLTSVSFWESLPYDKVLIFQADSELLREGIEDFTEWSFIGAPHYKEKSMMNGGLSIRDVEHCALVCKKYAYTGAENEDWYFTKHLRKDGRCTPIPSHAEKFAVETIFCLGSIGCHAIDYWLSKNECKRIRNQYKSQVVGDYEHKSTFE